MKKLRRTALALTLIVLYAGSAFALTAEEVIKLRKAGVSDETIRLMIEQERAGRQDNPADRIGVREVKDADGARSVLYSTGKPSAPGQNESEQEKVDRAWKMLRNQNVIIDDRRR
ncbi:MAG TPA: hypothetical protein PLH28_08630 [Syntrophales bacterium]|nr:hypothetical protein [Syntrophales bacterium]